MMEWSNSDDGAFGVTVTETSRAALLADIDRRLRAGEGFSIATLNLDHTVKLSRDPAFRAAYGAHSHVTADGNPIVWLEKLAGKTVELIPGSELIEPVVQLAAQAGVPIGLLGSDDATLAAASERLKTLYPDLDVALQLAPPMGFDPNGTPGDEAIKALRSSGARVVFLALGAPKQEIFASRAQKVLPGVGFLSIGAGVDFIAGTQTRAPRWVRALAAEWLWRLTLSPRRLLKRYAICLAILPGLTVRAFGARRRVAADQ